MRILEVVTSATWGGAQAQALAIADALSERGHSVDLACGGQGELIPRAREAGIEVTNLRWLRAGINPVHELLAVQELAAVIRHIRPDVIHTHSSKAGVIGRLAASAAGAPSVRPPLVVHHCHGLSWGPGRRQGIAVAIYRTAERWTGHLCSGVISVSHDVSNQLRAQGLYPRAEHRTIYNGVELGPPPVDPSVRTAARAGLGLPVAGYLVAIVGRLVPGKGHAELLAALEGLAALQPGLDIRVIIVGEGPLRASIEARVQGNALLCHRVSLLGFRSDVGRLLRACDALCLPSAAEGLPLVAIEAMGAALPVVAFRVGGVDEVVADGETGLLVDREGGPDPLGAAIAGLAGDLSWGRRLGLAGRTRAEQLFTLQNAGQSVDFISEMHTRLRQDT